MGIKRWKNIKILFTGTCWSITLALVMYWIYKFSLNENLCTVDFKKYYQDSSDVYPVLSLCFNDPISSNKLEMLGKGTNKKSYLQFLEGKFFTSNMSTVNYNHVSMDIRDYIVEYWIMWRNGSSTTYSALYGRKHWVTSTISGFWDASLFKCFGIHAPPDNHIEQFAVLLRNDIFPSRTRPVILDFFTLIYYPNQLTRSKQSFKFSWPERKTNNTYDMRFIINSVEVIRRRNTGRRPCDENWKYHDDRVILKHISNAGCQPPYLEPSKSIRACSNAHEMNKSKFTLNKSDKKGFPLCKEMNKVLYTYEEGELMSTEWGGDKNTFWAGLYFYDSDFKEIVQTRAIDVQTLIGNIGGYIGLCLGYSILQIPGLVVVIVRKIRKYRLEKSHWKVYKNSQTNPLQIALVKDELKTPQVSNTNYTTNQSFNDSTFSLEIEMNEMAHKSNKKPKFINEV